MEKKKVEEKKNVEKQEVKKEKLTYDELNNVCHQLSEQARNLYQQLQVANQKLEEANLTNAFRRLDYLFEILDKYKFFAEDFIAQCVNEITTIMTIPEQEPEKED